MTTVNIHIVSRLTDWVEPIVLALYHLCVITLSNLSRFDETTGIGRVLR